MRDEWTALPPEIIFDETIDYLNKLPSTIKRPFAPKCINEVTYGIPPKSIIVVAARPSEGKSTFAMNTASMLVNSSIPVAYISLEDSRIKFMQRFLSYNCHIPNFCFKNEKWKERLDIEKTRKMLSYLQFIILDEFGKSFAEVERIITELDPMPEVVFLDYVQLIHNYRNYTRRESIDYFMRQCKALTNNLNISIVILSQISRSAKNEMPQIWQLKEAGAIEESADIVILLHYPYRYEILTGNTDTELDPSLMKCCIAKNKDGEVRTLQLKFEPEYYRITDPQGL